MCKLKKAFTMIELVIVIVVVGILASVLTPKFDRNSLLEAADQVVSHIRYAQHLAINQNVFDSNDPTWFNRRWGVRFNNLNNEFRYSVCRKISPNLNGGCNSVSNARYGQGIAVDPQSPNKILSGGYDGVADANNLNRNMNLGVKFGVQAVVFGGGCAGAQTITFDDKGRPYNTLSGNIGVASNLITAPCTITLTNDGPAANGENQAVITIQPETGFARITWFPKCENTQQEPNKCTRPS